MECSKLYEIHMAEIDIPVNKSGDFLQANSKAGKFRPPDLNLVSTT